MSRGKVAWEGFPEARPRAWLSPATSMDRSGEVSATSTLASDILAGAERHAWAQARSDCSWPR